jgi:flagellar hook-associated protein 2
MAMIDGLVSGLDTTSLIRQLMALERQPVVRLQARMSAIDARIAAYQALNTRFATIGDAARQLSSPSGWQASRATTTAPDVLVASASSNAPAGSLTVRVDQLAGAHSLVSRGTATSLDEQITAPDTILTVRAGGDPVEVNLGSGSLASVVQAINASPAGIRAAATKVGADAYRLVLTSATSGAAGTISLDPPDAFLASIGSMDELTPATDARLIVGTGAGAFEVRSSTNTFVDVPTGVTLTAKATSSEAVRIDVGTDHAAVADRVQRLVDAVNGALGYIAGQSAQRPESNRAGPLAGDSTARRLQQELISAVSRGGTPADLGIELTRGGTLTFDRERFLAAYQADPAAVAERFTATGGVLDGFARRVEAIATSATRPGNGIITAAIEGRRSAIRQIEQQIDSWDDRLALREQALRRQFTGLEAALGNLQNQSTWLAGQLAGLHSRISR